VSKLVNKLLVLGGLTNNRHTMFKFSEPPGTPRNTLFNGLLDGTYKKAFLIEEFEYRSMCFALDGSTQSEMRIDDPYALVNEYKRDSGGRLRPHRNRERSDRTIVHGKCEADFGQERGFRHERSS
jgi:hypothetical protein